MSDRQLALFFKKPVELVCGRFYHDQLNRPIAVHGKKKSLPRHFFRYTWPAFLLMLKACVQEADKEFDTTIGVVVETHVPNEMPMMGNVLPEITTVDSLRARKAETSFLPPAVKGEVESVVMHDSSAAAIDVDKGRKSPSNDAAFVSLDSTEINLDTLTICTRPAEAREELMLMGAVIVSAADDINKELQNAIKPKGGQTKTGAKPVVFPNPVAMGGMLNVHFNEAKSGVYRIFSVSGQQLKHGKFSAAKNGRFSIPICTWLPGTYVLQFIDAVDNTSFTEKFIVQ
jgi:hypothetical protein